MVWHQPVLCPCGEEVGYGELATAEERARGLCCRCEFAGPPPPPPFDLRGGALSAVVWSSGPTGQKET